MVFKKSQLIFRLHLRKFSKILLPELIEIRLLVLLGNYVFRIESKICTAELHLLSILPDKAENRLVEAWIEA